MKHRWTTLLWELFAAQLLCTAAAMLPGSPVCTDPALGLPALGLAAAVPTAWFVWGVWAEPPPAAAAGTAAGTAPDTGPSHPAGPAGAGGVKNKNPCTGRSGTEVLFVNQTAIKRSC